MRVLKFGGSSVANAENIKKVIGIVTQSNYDKLIVVVSALGGVTDQLILAGSAAAKGGESFKTILSTLQTKHLEAAKALLPATTQSSCLSMVMQNFNELEDICEGVFRLQELSLRTKDRIISFGELLSSKIIS